MKTSQHLAIIFGSLGGVLLALGCSLFARFQFRKRTRRSIPVDPAFEARLQHMAEGEKGQAPKSVVATGWGVYPVAGVGPNRTKTYFNGWFGLDKGTGAGWTRDGASAPTPSNDDADIPRESHWSRASRRSGRGGSGGRGGGAGDGVDDMGVLEQGGRSQVPVEDFVEDEFELDEDDIRVRYGGPGEHDAGAGDRLRPSRR